MWVIKVPNRNIRNNLIFDFSPTVDPKFVDKLNLKDSSLDGRLKNVYVTSQDRFVS